MKTAVTLSIIMMGALEIFASSLKVCTNCSITTIREAISVSAKGDTIEIDSGIYAEGTITINKPLYLRGKNWPILDGQNEFEIIQIKSDSVVITGLMFRNVGVSFIKDNAAINIENAKNCKIESNKFHNAFFGIYAKNSANIEILNNEVVGEAEQEISSGNAIHLWYCKSMTIRNNKVSNHRDGIYLEFVNNSLIEGNESFNNLRYGLHFMFSNHDKYFGNTFRNNGAGVAVMYSKEIQMVGNTFELNWGPASYGLLLKEITDANIIKNKIENNTVGIYAEGANRLMMIENIFFGNGWALKISGSCYDNTISKNNFISNTFDLSTNSSRNQNNYDGNYWSEYVGYDLDKDGRGDVPYKPVRLFSYMAGKVEPSIVLLRSFFISIIDFAEKVTPMFTPQSLVDNEPLMKPWHNAPDF